MRTLKSAPVVELSGKEGDWPLRVRNGLPFAVYRQYIPYSSHHPPSPGQPPEDCVPFFSPKYITLSSSVHLIPTPPPRIPTPTQPISAPPCAHKSTRNIFPTPVRQAVETNRTSIFVPLLRFHL